MSESLPLTQAQKFTLRYFGDWEFQQKHSNGDITVVVGKGINKQYHRISPEGKLIRRSSASGESTTSFQPSLSEELSAAVKTPTKPAKKPGKYVPVSYGKTPCQENPACCHPRKGIKALFFDADHTIWDLAGTAAGVTGKLKKIDEATVVELGKPWGGYNYELPKYSRWNIEDYLSPEEKGLLEGLSVDEKDFLLEEMAREHNEISERGKGKGREGKEGSESESIRTTIKLDPTFRPLLDELDKRGIKSSIISLNTPGSVKRILKEFGLEDRFIEVRDSYENKGRVFQQITKKFGFCPCDSIFVDDGRGNVQDVSDKCGIGLQIGKGKDIEKIGDVMKYIEE